MITHECEDHAHGSCANVAGDFRGVHGGQIGRERAPSSDVGSRTTTGGALAIVRGHGHRGRVGANRVSGDGLVRDWTHGQATGEAVRVLGV